jgi:hypothetical protein
MRSVMFAAANQRDVTHRCRSTAYRRVASNHQAYNLANVLVSQLSKLFRSTVPDRPKGTTAGIWKYPLITAVLIVTLWIRKENDYLSDVGTSTLVTVQGTSISLT